MTTPTAKNRRFVSTRVRPYSRRVICTRFVATVTRIKCAAATESHGHDVTFTVPVSASRLFVNRKPDNPVFANLALIHVGQSVLPRLAFLPPRGGNLWPIPLA
jgi:hypothetical protein